MHVMHEPKLSGVDLNLFVLLDALLVERSVTRAAKRVGLSQSAASHALARLRSITGDPLFVRGPRGMLPTPRAEALAAPLREALAGLDRALAPAAPFVPHSSRRSFTIVGGDLAELVLFPPLFARLGKEAPGIDLHALPTPADAALALERGEVDLAIAPVRSFARATKLSEQPLFEDGFVCVVRRGHPLGRGAFGLERYLSARHAVIAPRGARGGIVDDLLASMGRERRVVLTIPHFLAAPYVVAQSDLVLTLPARVAEVLARPLGLCVLKPPLRVPRFTMAMAWHRRVDDDPGHRWLRGVYSEVARSLVPAKPAPRR
jgi:DNA-binding transcriptional LysR family regulator